MLLLVMRQVPPWVPPGLVLPQEVLPQGVSLLVEPVGGARGGLLLLLLLGLVLWVGVPWWGSSRVQVAAPVGAAAGAVVGGGGLGHRLDLELAVESGKIGTVNVDIYVLYCYM